MTDQPSAPQDDAPKPRRSNWVFMLPISVVLLIVAVSVSRLVSDKPAPASFASPIRPVPAIQTSLLDGGQIDFAQLKGPVIVNFWAPWCTPCRAEHPVLVKMKEDGVPIIGVMFMDTSDKANVPAAIERGKALIARDGNPFQQTPVDPTGDVSLGFGIAGVPETFLVDAKGMIVKSIRSPIADQATMQDWVDAYHAELAKAGKS